MPLLIPKYNTPAINPFNTGIIICDLFASTAFDFNKELNTLLNCGTEINMAISATMAGCLIKANTLFCKL